MAVIKAVAAPVRPEFVRSVLAAAAAEVGVEEGEVTVRITGDRELRRLNRQFLAEDHPTDVLSFPGEAGYLGDIAVAWPAVRRQALEFGHPDSAELAVLCVHGFLHLLGWDHADAESERGMWAATRRCLAAAGVEDVAAGRLVESQARP